MSDIKLCAIQTNDFFFQSNDSHDNYDDDDKKAKEKRIIRKYNPMNGSAMNAEERAENTKKTA